MTTDNVSHLILTMAPGEYVDVDGPCRFTYEKPAGERQIRIGVWAVRSVNVERGDMKKTKEASQLTATPVDRQLEQQSPT